MRCLGIVAFVSSVVLVAAPTARAAAQGSASLASAREALTRYDLAAGSASLRALGELAPVATGASADAAEARAMRALAGTELWAAASLLGDEAARARVAAALGVTVADAAAHLTSELAAVARGTYRTACREATELLELLDALATEGGRLASASGPRRDAAFALFVREHHELEALAVLGSAVESEAVAGWDETSRRALGALREALGAAGRATRAASAGDPLLALVADELAEVSGVVTRIELRPRVAPPADPALAAVEDVGAACACDAVVLVGAREVRVGLAPVVRIDERGALVAVRAGEVLPALRTVTLPAELTTVPQSIDALVAAVAGLGIPTGGSVLVAPVGAVPAHVMTRTFLSLARASVTPTHLGAARADGALVSIPLRVARDADAGATDARVRVRLGGYAVSRGARGRDTTLPRVRDAAGALAFDAAGLRAFLESGAHASLALEAMATVAAADVVRAAFLAARTGAAVTWVLP